MISFNPSISLILALVYSLALSFTSFSFIYLLPVFLLSFYLKSHLFAILKKLLFLNLFIFILFFILLIQDSFKEAIDFYLRVNLILFFNLCIFYYSKGYDIVRALCLLKFPNKFTSSAFFTIKMIETLSVDFKNLKLTLKARGFKAKTNLFTYYTFGNILALLFVKSLKKAQALRDTFISRSFSGQIYLNDEFNISKADYILIVIVVLTILLKVVL